MKLKAVVLKSFVASAFESVSVQLQQAACHNAMVAMTALAERRREYDEVEAYLRSVHPAPSERPTAALG